MPKLASIATTVAIVLLTGSYVVAAESRLPDVGVAVAAVASRIPATCRGINTATHDDPRFGHVDRFAGERDGRRVATYEIHLALQPGCAEKTVKAVTRAVKNGLRIAPDRRIAAFAVHGDGPGRQRDILMFYVPVADDAEWKQIGG